MGIPRERSGVGGHQPTLLIESVAVNISKCNDGHAATILLKNHMYLPPRSHSLHQVQDFPESGS